LRQDKILGNSEIPKKIKKKNERMINKKIKNLKDELHWKTINYLTKKHKIILIGNLSTKRIINNGNNKNNLNKMTKRIAVALSFYQFRERLKYKCYIRDTKYKLVDEFLTSKLCTKCGNEKKDLGTEKVYDCASCNIKIDRDVNGARNILLKSL